MNKPAVHVISPPGNISEKKYIFDVLIEDFLNLHYSFEVTSETRDYQIQKGENKAIIPDIFFAQVYNKKDPDYPKIQNINIDLNLPVSQKLPAWFLHNTESFLVSKNNDFLPVDIIGMAFFLLSGYADIHFSEKDEHLRSRGSSSFVVRNNLIDRPIIQEWFMVITQMLYKNESIKPGKQIPAYSKHVSHDVDQPFEYLFYTKTRLVKRMIGDMVIRKNKQLARKRFKNYLSVKRGDFTADPYNNFSEMISLLENEGIKSTFFFVSGDNESEYDVIYDIDHPAMKMIIKDLHNAGHKIGLHPSYKTWYDVERLKEERKKLINICHSLKLKAEIDCVRKHYLRWNWEKTPVLLQEAGIKHDYTVGYADRTGYRTGVAFPYRGFNWDKKKPLNIRLHPLIVMEASLLSDKYMGLSLKQAGEKLKHYHNQLQSLGGEFVLLWHNHCLIDEKINLFKTFLRL